MVHASPNLGYGSTWGHSLSLRAKNRERGEHGSRNKLLVAPHAIHYNIANMQLVSSRTVTLKVSFEIAYYLLEFSCQSNKTAPYLTFIQEPCFPPPEIYRSSTEVHSYFPERGQ